MKLNYVLTSTIIASISIWALNHTLGLVEFGSPLEASQPPTSISSTSALPEPVLAYMPPPVTVQANPLGSARGPLLERWRIPDAGTGYDHESARIYVLHEDSGAQTLMLQWLVVGHVPPTGPAPTMSAERGYGARYDVLMFEADPNSRSIALAGVHEPTGTTVVENWDFSTPVVNWDGKKYAPGKPNNVTLLYSGINPGMNGVRGVATVPATVDSGSVAAQFEDSGSIHTFPKDGSASQHLFGKAGSGATYTYTPSNPLCKMHLCGVVDSPANGNILVIQPGRNFYATESVVRVVLFDADLDGSFDFMEEYTRTEWENFSL